MSQLCASQHLLQIWYLTLKYNIELVMCFNTRTAHDFEHTYAIEYMRNAGEQYVYANPGNCKKMHDTFIALHILQFLCITGSNSRNQTSTAKLEIMILP